MRDQLAGLAEKVDLVVAESRGVLPDPVLEQAAEVAGNVRLRLSYPASVLIVALAGGTGSGKSSLFNAIAGADLSLTGGIRPMTVEPLTIVPAGAAADMAGYLDALGLDERFEHHGPPWLCLIDLPDNDSVELEHRHQVDTLLPKVDIVVWVTDPEKYRDASLHQGHIARLASRQRQFLYVLNQMDRLAPGEVASVTADFAQALREDRITDPVVLATSAQPPAGPPAGIEELVERLGRAGGEEAVHDRLATDLRDAAAGLAAAAAGLRSVDFETRWRSELGKALDLATQDRTTEAGHSISRFLTGLSTELGGQIGDAVREVAREAPSRFVGMVAEASVGEPSRRWGIRGRSSSRGGPGQPDPDELRSAVDTAIGGDVRELLERRTRSHEAIEDLDQSLGRIAESAT